MFNASFLLASLLAVALAGMSITTQQSTSVVDKAFVLTPPIAELTSSENHRDAERRTEEIVTRAEDGLFYTYARVNGASVRFVVDTGSNIVVLTAHDARRAGVMPSVHYEAAMESAGGLTRMHRQTLKQIVIAGRSIKNVDAATVQGDLRVSLLGQSAISQLTSIKLEGDRMILN